jgi:cell division protein FtsA
MVLEQLASCNSVLTEDEKELGVCLIDIGGGTTDIAIFVDGAIKHTAVIPIAGDQVTNDIAVALRTPTLNAEEIKRKYACALTQLAQVDGSIEVPSIGDRAPRKISTQNLAEIIEPRYEELMLLVQAELRRSGYEELIAAGIVLTGGSSRVMGLIELAEEIFHMPVRMGIPQNVTGLTEVVKNPAHSTGVGLLMYGKEHQGSERGISADGSGLLAKMKSWFQGNF